MQYKTIQGVSVPEIGLGTYQLHGKKCEDAVRMALDIGYRHVDTAQMYQNEMEVGEALKNSPVDREDVFLTSKLWMNNLEYEDVLRTTEESLTKLQTPYLDLLLIHWPSDQYSLQHTLEAMLLLRDQGKVSHIGVSNFPLSLLQEANEEIGAPIFCNQVEYHPYLGQFDLLEYAIDEDIMITAYGPLAEGHLENSKTLQRIGQKYDKTPNQVGLRWLIEQEQVVAIPRASSRDRLEENIDIFDFELSDDDFDNIDNLDKSNRYNNPSFAPKWE